MTTNGKIRTPTIMPFEQWANNPFVDAPLEPEQCECPECYGDGMVECEYCSNIVPCQECEGEGTIMAPAQDLYLNQKAIDLMLWERWYKGEPFIVPGGKSMK